MEYSIPKGITNTQKFTGSLLLSPVYLTNYTRRFLKIDVIPKKSKCLSPSATGMKIKNYLILKKPSEIV